MQVGEYIQVTWRYRCCGLPPATSDSKLKSVSIAVFMPKKNMNFDLISWNKCVNCSRRKAVSAKTYHSAMSCTCPPLQPSKSLIVKDALWSRYSTQEIIS